MEFQILTLGSSPDLDAIEAVIRTVDASALVDVDPTGHTLRVAGSVDAVQLVALLGQAGYPVAQQQVVQVPSVCCGGCSG